MINRSAQAAMCLFTLPIATDFILSLPPNKDNKTLKRKATAGDLHFEPLKVRSERKHDLTNVQSRQRDSAAVRIPGRIG